MQTVKRLLTKAKADGKHLYLSLLEYRNTPIYDVGFPSQLLMSHQLQFTLPNTESQLQRKVVHPRRVEKKLKEKQGHHKKYYDVGARALPSLQKGERVRVHVGGQWKEATVSAHRTTPRSVNLKTSSGREIRSNRVHMKKQNNDVVAEKKLIENEHSEPGMHIETTLPNLSQPDQSPEYRTQSGRISKPPEPPVTSGDLNMTRIYRTTN